MTVCAIVIAPRKGCDPNGQVVNTPLGFQTIPAIHSRIWKKLSIRKHALKVDPRYSMRVFRGPY